MNGFIEKLSVLQINKGAVKQKSIMAHHYTFFIATTISVEYLLFGRALIMISISIQFR